MIIMMMETDLRMMGLPTSSVREMSFEEGGYDAYVDMDSHLVDMTQEGPSHLLTGSIAINRNGALLSAWLYEMETGRLILSEQVTGSQEDLVMKLPEDLATRLNSALEEASPPPIPGDPGD